MVQYIPRLKASLVLSLVLVASACAKKDDTAAADSALNSDIQLASRDTAAQPALTDVPAASATAPAPSASAPRTTTRTTTPTTRTPTTTTRKPTTTTTTTTSSGNTVTRNTAGTGARVGTIPAGSELNLTSGSRICTNTSHVGERFNATVTNSVAGSNGAAIPVGATASVEVTELKRSENANDNVVMGFRVVSVTYGGHTYPVSATTSYAQVNKVKNQPKGKDVQKVVGGAAGGAAGAAAAAATSNYEGCVYSGGRITATLNSSTQVNI